MIRWSVPPLRSLLIAALLLAPSAVAGAARPSSRPAAQPARAYVPAPEAGQPLDAQALRSFIRQAQRRRILDEPMRELRENRERRERAAAARAKAKGRPGRGLAKRDERSGIPIDRREGLAPAPAAAMAAPEPPTLAAVPANVRANNPAGDPAGTCQSEESIASFGPYALVAWNDGVTDQGYGWSFTGGASFQDGGAFPPVPNGMWVSDPVVTVNEKTGEFWYCALVDFLDGSNAVGVLKVTLSPTGPTFSGPWFSRIVSGFDLLIDKPWMVADSLSGNLYLTYTAFTALDDSILFQRSTDGGVSWSDPLVLNSDAAAGLVQGSRPAVGPAGEVYAVWWELGFADQDFQRSRVSSDQGLTFDPEVTVAAFAPNLGSGAPGYDREVGFPFPSIAVDRTAGVNRGRAYVAFNESINWFDDLSLLGLLGSRLEAETNGPFARANAFTPGQLIRGSLISGDADTYSFAATAGQSYFFICDSIPNALYTMRVFCSDTTTRLALSGDFDPSPTGDAAFYCWTAPATGTFYLRMTWLPGGAASGYRILTGLVDSDGEPGRDQRDVMVVSTDDGVNWTPQALVNDSPPLYDDWLPEVAVAADGYPYASWYDWRLVPACGGTSHIYVSRSDDGGATWRPGERITTQPTAWSSVVSDIAPNQGDYMSLFPDARYLRPAWADGRSGNPDVYTASMDTWFLFTRCPADTALVPGAGAQVDIAFAAVNQNPLFGEDYAAEVVSDRGWPVPAPLDLTAGPNGPFGGILSVAVPDSAAPGVTEIDLVVRNSTGALVGTCHLRVNLQGGTTAAGEGRFDFALGPVAPNPARGAARMTFTLPREGRVTLDIYGLQGERIARLADGAFAPGLHTLSWDGRDDRGRPVPSGTSFCRLEGLGHVATRRMVWMR